MLRYVADWVIARGAEVSADEREGGKGDVAVGEAAFHDIGMATPTPATSNTAPAMVAIRFAISSPPLP